MRLSRALPLVIAVAAGGGWPLVLPSTSRAAQDAPGSASPLPPPSPSGSASAGARAEARALFSEGLKLYEAGEYAKALEKFVRARDLVPVAAVRFNVGRCLGQLGRLVEAVAELDAAQSLATAEGKDSISKEAAVAAAEIRGRLPTLTLSISPASATVKVDGALVSASKPLALDPGTHTIEVSAPNHATATKSVVLVEKGKTSLAIKLVPK